MHIGNLLFSIDGRINRKTWWTLQIALYFFSVLTLYLYHKFGFHDAIFGAVITVLLFVVRIFVNLKRWHDRGKSAWWLLIEMIPVVGWIWATIELGCLKGHEGENDYGAAP